MFRKSNSLSVLSNPLLILEFCEFAFVFSPRSLILFAVAFMCCNAFDSFLQMMQEAQVHGFEWFYLFQQPKVTSWAVPWVDLSLHNRAVHTSRWVTLSLDSGAFGKIDRLTDVHLWHFSKALYWTFSRNLEFLGHAKEGWDGSILHTVKLDFRMGRTTQRQD